MAGDSSSEWTEALSAFVVRNARAVIVAWIVVVAGLIEPGARVEIEATAVV